ncbi:hypothetical protein DY000_02058502 [Brassica cretica]|uniref:Uncharacterized protein n=1 Tax=Brassica cretica TaxID=69181 RepID=A0ABQ7AP47_BRACR|nr:hypothetical protein DY000_02058502 [Brassica cretica]
MKEMKRSERFSRDDTEEFIEAWIHGRIPEWCRKPVFLTLFSDRASTLNDLKKA